MSDGIRSGVNCTRLVSSPITMPKRVHQLGLGQARHADQKAMAAGQQGDQGLLDHLVLAEDHRVQAGAHLPKVSAAAFRRPGASRSSRMSTLFIRGLWGWGFAS